MNSKQKIARWTQFLLFLLIAVCAVLYFVYRFGWAEIPSYMIKDQEGKILGAALRAYRHKDYQLAAEGYRRYLEGAPEDAEGWYGLAVSLGQAGEKNEAFAAAVRASELKPSERRYHGAIALLHIGREEYSQAIKIYDRLLEVNYHDQASLANRAFAYHRWGKGEQAFRYYLQAVKEFPGSPELHYTVGVIYYDRGGYDKALEHSREATNLNLKYEEAYLLMARCSQAKGDQEQMKYYLERCLVLASEDKQEVIREAKELLAGLDKEL